MRRATPLGRSHGRRPAAGVAVSAAIENLLLFEYQPTSLAVGMAALDSTLTVMPNQITVPFGPGLGVEVDRTVVQHLRKESDR